MTGYLYRGVKAASAARRNRADSWRDMWAERTGKTQ